MTLIRSHRTRMIALAGVAMLALPLAACSATSNEDSGTADGAITLSFLIDNGEQTIASVDALTEAYTAENPNVTFDIETRPGGGEGDNIVKTRLATGEMSDLFVYNSGALLQALSPDKTLIDLSDQPWQDDVLDVFTTAVSTKDGSYGAPLGGSMAGAVLYNIPLYEKLGLTIPTTWDEFLANSEAVKADGTAAPIIQSYGDTWTSQLFVLGDMYNVLAEDPEWADKYTVGERKYAEQPALSGFEHLQEVAEAGLLNKDFASATYDDGMRMVATGEGAHYPMLTFAVGVLVNNHPENLNDVGLFPLPGDKVNGLTTWAPPSMYIPKSTEGAKLDAVKDFLAFTTSIPACDIVAEAAGVNGPHVVKGCELPADTPQLVKDMQPFFDSGDTNLALEYLSPIKGPALEQITVEVGSGIRSAKDGAALYDEDVKKQAQQLGIEGW